MRKHYLLLAHDQPSHVRRLIDRLDDGEATFWVHLDARVDPAGWSDVLGREHVVGVEPRFRCLWGTWSLVEAMLATVSACVAGDVPGYLVMLSGQTYPVKSTEHIDAYLTEHASRIHMDFWSLQERWPDNYQNRLDYFCIPLSEAKGDLGLLRRRQDMNLRELVGWTRRLVRRTGPRRALVTLRQIGIERPDVSDQVVGGSQWWGLPWDVAVDLMALHNEGPALAEFLRWSQYPDESYFQSLIASMGADTRARIGPTLTHIDWTEGDWDLPRVMGVDDVPTLLALPEPVLFARKFLTPGSDDAASALDAAF